MPALFDGDQEATDHGNLMDLDVVEVERESVEGAGGQDDQSAGETTKATQPKSASDGGAKRIEPSGPSSEPKDRVLEGQRTTSEV
jgi:hypothetical protein